MYHPVVRPLILQYRKINNRQTKDKIKDFLRNLDIRIADLLNRSELPPPVTQAPTRRRPTPSIAVVDSSYVLVVNRNGRFGDIRNAALRNLKLTDLSFSDGLAAIKNEAGLWGFINPRGKMMIPFQYDEVTDFFNGNAQVMKGEQVFYINKKGNCIKDCPDKATGN